MSLAAVIQRVATGTYTVTRRVAGTYTAGRLVAGATSTFSIRASVQPVDGHELQALPEGQHGEEVRVVLTSTELRARTAANAGDQIAIDGETWEVFRVETWIVLGKTHYEAMIDRKALP